MHKFFASCVCIAFAVGGYFCGAIRSSSDSITPPVSEAPVNKHSDECCGDKPPIAAVADPERELVASTPSAKEQELAAQVQAIAQESVEKDNQIRALQNQISALEEERVLKPILQALAGPSEMLPDEVGSVLKRSGLFKETSQLQELNGLIQSGTIDVTTLYKVISDVERATVRGEYALTHAKGSSADLASVKQNIETKKAELTNQLLQMRLPPSAVDNLNNTFATLLAKF